MSLLQVLVGVGGVVLVVVVLRAWHQLPRGPWTADQWRRWMATVSVLFLIVIVGGALWWLSV